MSKEKLFLSLQTAVADPFVALSIHDQLLDVIVLKDWAKLSETLHSSIQTLLTRNNYQLSDVSAIAICQGPGSFTGMRIGATTAEVLGYAANISLIEYNSLECFEPKEDGTFTSALDARSGGVYYMIGSKKGESITYLSRPEKKSMEEFSPVGPIITSDQSLLEKVKFPDNPVFIKGFSLERLAKIIVEKEKNNFLTKKLSLYYLSNPS